MDSQQPDPAALFSIQALRRAWRVVRRNGVTPGCDGVTLEQFESTEDIELNRLRQQILGGTYQPLPVWRFYVRKPSGKQRAISVWAVRDRVAQRVVLDYLTPMLEGLFLDSNYGFRPGRSPEQAVVAVLEAREAGLLWVLDADIADCFDSIPLPLLLAQIERIVPSEHARRLIGQWLNTPVVKERGRVAAVSQGGVISPSLANLYLHRFDEMVVAALPQTRLIRFADDFVVLCRTEQDAVWSLDVARRSLENLRLRLNMRKTRIVHFDEGFTFLGTTFKARWHHSGQAPEDKDET